MSTYTNMQVAEQNSNVQTILDSLEYLSVEADKEGMPDVKNLVSNVILKIKNRPHGGDIDHLTHSTDKPANIPQLIDLVNSLSSLDQNQLSALKKIVNLV